MVSDTLSDFDKEFKETKDWIKMKFREAGFGPGSPQQNTQIKEPVDDGMRQFEKVEEKTRQEQNQMNTRQATFKIETVQPVSFNSDDAPAGFKEALRSRSTTTPKPKEFSPDRSTVMFILMLVLFTLFALTLLILCVVKLCRGKPNMMNRATRKSSTPHKRTPIKNVEPVNANTDPALVSSSPSQTQNHGRPERQEMPPLSVVGPAPSTPSPFKPLPVQTVTKKPVPFYPDHPSLNVAASSGAFARICSVCYGNLEGPAPALPCGHAFHFACLQHQNPSGRDMCPICPSHPSTLTH